MLGLSWQVTVLALLLLPIFVLPAKRMGRRLAALNREAADHNAAMGTQMTERFSAPGATLVKLFGRPADETREFVARAARVRDIGVRTAMVQWVFVSALTLVSALALALVYGLGGWFALAGSLDPGDVVALALLLTRLYAPLTSLASARVEVMSALVSFERVFEVLDLPPLIAEPATPLPLPDGPLSVELDDVRFAYPPADRVSLASLEEVARPRHPRRRRGAARRVVPGRAGADGRAGRLVGRGQVDDRLAAPPPLRRRRGRGADRRRRRARPRVRLDPRRARARHAGRAPVPRDRCAPTCLLARPDADGGRAVGRAAPRPPGRPRRDVARRARHRGRRARLPPLRRRTPTPDDRAAAAGPARASSCSTRPPRTSTPRPRPPSRRRSREALAGPHRDRDRPPAVDHPRGRPDPRRRGRPRSSSAARTSSCWPGQAATPSCTAPSSPTWPPRRGSRRSAPSRPSCPRPCPWPGAAPSPRPLRTSR